MRYTINDEVYKRINKKVLDGTFEKGKKCVLRKYILDYFKGKTIMDFPVSERTPEICASLIDYGKCRLYDVPDASKTKEFFISTFTNDEVFSYIRDNIEKFDRQFFKDLIETEEYATSFDNNCFSIMPLEYIDEEMCSLAILCSLDWNEDSWFYSVYERKPKALTGDLWKLGARLYGRERNGENKFFSITPEAFKDEEYYKEMCSCSFNCGSETNYVKGRTIDFVPQEMVTSEILELFIFGKIDKTTINSDEVLEMKKNNIDISKRNKKKILVKQNKKDND